MEKIFGEQQCVPNPRGGAWSLGIHSLLFIAAEADSPSRLPAPTHPSQHVSEGGAFNRA